MALLRRLAAAGVGAAVATWPVLAAAQDGGSRAVGVADDFWKVALVTALGVGALLAMAAIGYLYRRERGLAWYFQLPDPDEQDDEEH